MTRPVRKARTKKPLVYHDSESSDEQEFVLTAEAEESESSKSESMSDEEQSGFCSSRISHKRRKVMGSFYEESVIDNVPDFLKPTPDNEDLISENEKSDHHSWWWESYPDSDLQDAIIVPGVEPFPSVFLSSKYLTFYDSNRPNLEIDSLVELVAVQVLCVTKEFQNNHVPGELVIDANFKQVIDENDFKEKYCSSRNKKELYRMYIWVDKASRKPITENSNAHAQALSMLNDHDIAKYCRVFASIKQQSVALTIYLKVDELKKDVVNGKDSISENLIYLFRDTFVTTNRRRYANIKELPDTLDELESEPSAGFKLTLFPHQKRTLHWLSRLEKDPTSRNISYTSVDNMLTSPIIQFGPNGCYCNWLTREISVTNKWGHSCHNSLSYLECPGGIDASKVGTGKTVTMLSLIHSRPLTSIEDLPNHDKLKTLFPNYLLSKATMVICPSNLATQWQSEAKRCLPNSTKIVLLRTIHDHRKISWNDILTADIVITTLQFLANTSYSSMIKECVFKSLLNTDKFKFSEKLSGMMEIIAMENFIRGLKAKGRSEYGTVQGKCILERILWYRIVVDEFHELGNNGKISNHFLNFQSVYRHGLTGTPQFDDESRIRTMMKNLKLDAFPEYVGIENKFVLGFIRQNDPELKLPPVEHQLVRVKMTTMEKALYDNLTRTMGDLGRLMQANHHQITGESDEQQRILTPEELSEKIQVGRLKRINQLERTIDDLKKELRDRNNEAEEAELSRLKNRIRNNSIQLDEIRASYNFLNHVLDIVKKGAHECPICLELIPKGSDFELAKCGHYFCVPCLSGLIQHSGVTKCPNCRQRIHDTWRMTVEKTQEPTQPEEESLCKYGSKLKYLVLFIRQCLKKDPTAKFIIFSQFRQLTNVVSASLTEFEIKNIRLQGNVFMRTKAVTEFKNEESAKVIMLNAEDDASGLNLTEANHVILLHPFMIGSNKWLGKTSQDYEQQGIARAVRFGQTRTVHVTRFLVEGTIEQQISTQRPDLKVKEISVE